LGAVAVLVKNVAWSHVTNPVSLEDRSHILKPTCPRADWFNLLCSAGNLGKIWSACGQNEIQYYKRGEMKGIEVWRKSSKSAVK